MKSWHLALALVPLLAGDATAGGVASGPSMMAKERSVTRASTRRARAIQRGMGASRAPFDARNEIVAFLGFIMRT
jgi:hypothetical protein